MFLINGCAKKDLNPSSNENYSNDNDIATDTIIVDESSIASNSNGYNSSSNKMQSIYFEFGGYDLTAQMQSTIALNTNILNQKFQGVQVKLEGNCDEFGTDEYNYALGLKRTKSVKESLISQGISQSQIIVVSYGESNPQCREATDNCYARNRRVDLHLVR